MCLNQVRCPKSHLIVSHGGYHYDQWVDGGLTDSCFPKVDFCFVPPQLETKANVYRTHYCFIHFSFLCKNCKVNGDFCWFFLSWEPKL